MFGIDSILTLGFITSFLVVLLATPSLIKVAKLKHLVDEPGDERKLHVRSVPTIGGIIIFAAIIFAYALWYPSFKNEMSHIEEFKFIIASMIILFFVGVKDDIIGTAPVKKLLGHMVVAFILVMMADIRITSFHGLFGLGEIPDWASALLSFFVYIVIVNGFNLIDGVDGLAAGVGFIAAVVFGFMFHLLGNDELALLAFVLAGSLLAFLVFNFAPAKLFMGDSGSLIIGMITSVLAIKLIESDAIHLGEAYRHVSLPVVTMAILAYPLIDTLRVFTVRALNGNSPFTADRNHIHHRLLDFGWTHSKTVLSLYVYSALVIVISLFIQFEDPTNSFFILAPIAFGLASIPLAFNKKRK